MPLRALPTKLYRFRRAHSAGFASIACHFSRPLVSLRAAQRALAAGHAAGQL